MSFFEWLNERLNPFHHEPQRMESKQESDRLTHDKQVLAKFARDLEEGRVGDANPVVHIHSNILEGMIIPDRLTHQRKAR